MPSGVRELRGTCHSEPQVPVGLACVAGWLAGDRDGGQTCRPMGAGRRAQRGMAAPSPIKIHAHRRVIAPSSARPRPGAGPGPVAGPSLPWPGAGPCLSALSSMSQQRLETSPRRPKCEPRQNPSPSSRNIEPIRSHRHCTHIQYHWIPSWTWAEVVDVEDWTSSSSLLTRPSPFTIILLPTYCRLPPIVVPPIARHPPARDNGRQATIRPQELGDADKQPPLVAPPSPLQSRQGTPKPVHHPSQVPEILHPPIPRLVQAQRRPPRPPGPRRSRPEPMPDSVEPAQGRVRGDGRRRTPFVSGRKAKKV